MPEQTKQEEDLDASILESIESMKEEMGKYGVIIYQPANENEPEQKVTFNAIVAEEANQDALIESLRELYIAMKVPFPSSYANKLIALREVIDDMVSSHVELCARDKHGVEA